MQKNRLYKIGRYLFYKRILTERIFFSIIYLMSRTILIVCLKIIPQAII